MPRGPSAEVHSMPRGPSGKVYAEGALGIASNGVSSPFPPAPTWHTWQDLCRGGSFADGDPRHRCAYADGFSMPRVLRSVKCG